MFIIFLINFWLGVSGRFFMVIRIFFVSKFLYIFLNFFLFRIVLGLKFFVVFFNLVKLKIFKLGFFKIFLFGGNDFLKLGWFLKEILLFFELLFFENFFLDVFFLEIFGWDRIILYNYDN